jgi:prolyl-tRNA synthetase
VYCPTSDYAANIELAEGLALIAQRGAASIGMEKVDTPGKSTCADVAELLGLPLSRTVKSLVLATDDLNDKGEIIGATVWLLLVRGDHDLNEVKAGKIAFTDAAGKAWGLKAGFRFATEKEIIEHLGCKPGYLGPVFSKDALKKPVKVVADRTVANMADFVCGANEEGFHILGVNWGRDLPEPDFVADIRNVVEGEPSPDGKGVLAIQRGIEVGHVFYLGTKYSKAMNATFLDVDGKPKHFEMGCYGIGVTRILGAAIEQRHDERGIAWPDSIAPFTVVICPVGYDRSEEVKAVADKLYGELLAKGVDVIVDDRGERPGAMFADWELIGVPHRVVLGDKGLKEGLAEYQGRKDAAATKVGVTEVLNHVLSCLQIA